MNENKLNKQLYNMNIVIVGAGSGIGRAAALLFSDHGARVIIGGRNEDALRQVVASRKKGCIEFHTLDISDEVSVQKFFQFVAARFENKLDAAFNNAGVFGQFAKVADNTLENFDKVVSINLRGTWLCIKEEIKLMLSRKKGSIVNCSSVSGHLGHNQSAVYSATKHAVIGLTKSVALQYAEDNIRINAVSPGSTDTEMLRGLYSSQELLDKRKASIPMFRFGKPEEIANVAMWLCSEYSSFVTGQVVVADGGVVAGRPGR